MFYLRGDFARRVDTALERALRIVDARLRALARERVALANLVQSERITQAIAQEDSMAKKDHGKHTPNVAAVEAAMDAAGSDPRARITAGIKAVMANAVKLKNPNEQREAADHFAANIEGFVSYAFNEQQ